MKSLIIHHLQECWDTSLRMYGTSFEDMLEAMYGYLCENSDRYNMVILTNFESHQMEFSQGLLEEFVTHVHNYDYGWSKDMLDADYHEWVEGGSHSDVVLIDDWMKDLVEVDLCGAFDGECIEDITIALESQGVLVNRIESLIV